MKKALLSVLCVILVVTMLPLSAFAARDTGVKKASLSATVGKAVDQKFTYADYGITSSLYDISSTVSDVGLTHSYTGNYIRISGTPTKAGTATATVTFKDGMSLKITVTVTAPVEKTASLSATVGKAVDQKFTYADYGITSSLYDVSSTVSDVGLTHSYTGNYIRISGTPTKAGTATATVTFKDGSKFTVTVTVKAASAPVKKTIDLEYTVGDEIEYYVRQADYGISGKIEGYNTADNWYSCGLHTNFVPSEYLKIFGTAKKADKTNVVIKYDNGSEITANITIKEKSAPVEKTQKITKRTGVSMSHTYSFEYFGITSELVDNVGDDFSAYNLEFAEWGTGFRVSGMPSKTGTIKRTLTFKDGSKLIIEVNIVEGPGVPDAVEKTVTLKCTLGEEVDQTYLMKEDYGVYTNSNILPKYAGNLPQDLKCSYSMDSVRIHGTPTKAGTGMAVLSFDNGSKFTVNINVIDPNDTEVWTPDDPTPTTPDDPTPTTPDDPTPVTPADTYVFPFTDVLEKDWFYKDVYNANKMGLINGKTATLYKPNDNMTYAEAIKLAACMNQYYNDGEVTLTNGSPNWYDSYVEYARTHGIPWDYEDYNAKITRRDYVHIFYYALPKENYKAINNITAIPDVKSDDKYASEILAFYNAGILTGSDAKGTFNPSSNIKRSEVAAILSRMMDATTRKMFELK